MGFLSDALDWLAGAVEDAAGVPVTYARGATTAAVTAAVGRTVFRTNPYEGGVHLEFGERDFLIRASALAAFGVPARGDRVTDAAGVVFEVLPPDTGEPPWRYADPRRTVYRIHAKRVG